jgi:mycothiol synthase
MRSADMPAAGVLLAPVMGWWPALVRSTFGLGHEVVSEVVFEGDDVVGVVHLVSGMPGLPDGVLSLRLAVAEQARGAGIGAVLWQRVLDVLPSGATVSARAPADDLRSLAIAARWGFKEVNTTLYQSRELTAQALPVPVPVPNASLEIERGNLAGALYDRVAAAMSAGSALDVPIATDIDPDGMSGAFSTEPTMSIIAAQPGEVVAVFAAADDVDVGYSIAMVRESGWHIADTAVVPAWRRRGVAAWVKNELARLAAQDGAEWLTTHNDGDNTPILALNEASGFHVLRRIVALRRAP